MTVFYQLRLPSVCLFVDFFHRDLVLPARVNSLVLVSLVSNTTTRVMLLFRSLSRFCVSIAFLPVRLSTPRFPKRFIQSLNPEPCKPPPPPLLIVKSPGVLKGLKFSLNSTDLLFTISVNRQTDTSSLLFLNCLFFVRVSSSFSLYSYLKCIQIKTGFLI